MKVICSGYERFKKVCDKRTCSFSKPRDSKDFPIYYKIASEYANHSCILSTNYLDREGIQYSTKECKNGWVDRIQVWCRLVPVPITYYMEKVLDEQRNDNTNSNQE